MPALATNNVDTVTDRGFAVLGCMVTVSVYVSVSLLKGSKQGSHKEDSMDAQVRGNALLNKLGDTVIDHQDCA